MKELENKIEKSKIIYWKANFGKNEYKSTN